MNCRYNRFLKSPCENEQLSQRFEHKVTYPEKKGKKSSIERHGNNTGQPRKQGIQESMLKFLQNSPNQNQKTLTK